MVQMYQPSGGGGTMGLTGWNDAGSGWQGTVQGTMDAANPGGFGGLLQAMAGQGGAVPYSPGAPTSGVPFPSPTPLPGGVQGESDRRTPKQKLIDSTPGLQGFGDPFDFGGSSRGTGGGGGGGGGGGQSWGERQLPREQFEWQQQQYADSQAAGKQAAQWMPQLVESYNKAYGEAKSANEKRYQEMLAVIGQTTGQREADIRSDFTNREAGAMQGLARKGMAGTTVAPTMGMGYEREQQSALNRLADQMQGTKLGVMERKVDKYPDATLLSSLSSAIVA